MNNTSFPTPQSIASTGIPRATLEELALKTIYTHGEILLISLAQEMKLALTIIEELFTRLRQDQLIEVKGMVGGIHKVATTAQGRGRAVEALARNQYVGPTPITLPDYVKLVDAQNTQRLKISPQDIQRAFSHLVLSKSTLDQLGTALASGSSMFLYGPSGTGKTSVALATQNVFTDHIQIPYAIVIDGQIITVYDASIHKRTERQPDAQASDPRMVQCMRPRVTAGGELTIEMLDLQCDPIAKFYSAPLQVKANNGVLIIDDFGRQRLSPTELLNRWIVPLDRKVDYLTLAGGKKFEIPFSTFVVFSTNLDPLSLGDVAFLRRINSKVHVGSVDTEQFHQIAARVCQVENVGYNVDGIDYLADMIVNKMKEPLRPCYPRDIIRQIICDAQFRNITPVISRENVERACRNFFIVPSEFGHSHG